jgi:hypothetical protein
MSRRRINAIATSFRKTHARNMSQTSYVRDNIEPFSGPCELDSHADTCVLSSNIPITCAVYQHFRRHMRPFMIYRL